MAWRRLVKRPCVHLWVGLWRLSCSILREKKAKTFFSLERSPFFLKNLCFQQPLRSQEHALLSSTVPVRISCGTIWIVPWGLSHWILGRKWAKNFCHRANSYILKCLFLSTSQVLENGSYFSQTKLQKSMYTLINCSLRFVIIDNTRKFGQFFFFHWKGCPFLQKFVFSTTS